MSNGIDFVIGGKDNAKPAMASVEQGLSRLQMGTDRLKTATQGLMAAMGPLLAVYAAMKTAMAAIGGIDAANDQFDRTAEAVKGLEVALKIQGAAVETESARLQDYAETMQNVTGINDLAVMSLMKEASLLGVTSEKLDDMTTAALGLAEATGSDASTAMTQLRMATEGVFTSFNRSIPQLKHMATDEEKLAAVLELAAKGFEAKATWANKTAEAGAMAGNALDKLKESVGAILAPFRVLISTGIETLANSLTGLLAPAVKYATELLENMGPMIHWLKEQIVNGINAIIGAFTWLEVIFRNLDQVWIAVVAQAELSMLQMAGAIKHTLMEVIPAYAVWFGNNFITMLMGDFDAAMAALPDIAARAITQREKELAATVGQVGANLGQQFADKFAERMVGMGDGITDNLDTAIDLKLSKTDPEGGIGKRAGGTFGATINATESRLLTRGPASTVPELLQQLVRKMDQLLGKPGLQNDDKATIDAIKKKAQNAIELVPVP